MSNLSSRLALPIFFVAVLGLFSLAAPNFASAGNFENLMAGYAFIGILAIGQAFPILLRGIDLSVGAILALVGMSIFDMSLMFGLPGWLIVPVALMIGTAAGAVNGLMVTGLRLSPFIATLASLAAYRGLVYAISGRQLVPELSTKPITDPWITRFETYYDLTRLLHLKGVVKLPWMPLSFLILLATWGVLHFALTQTRFGRDLYTIGGNPEAARLAGIRVGALTVAAYAISGFCAGLAAVLLVARLTTSTEGLGEGVELTAIAAAVIGGFSLSGGTGRLGGAVIGTFLLGVVLVGLTQMGISPFVQQILTGVILLVAVGNDRLQTLRNAGPERGGAGMTLLEARGLSKSYGALQALKPSDLVLAAGEVRALIGSNGAGKSTLIKCLTGAVLPSTGEVLLEGRALPLGRPGEIIAAGVACIYQHSNLAPMMSVADNITMGRQPTRLGRIDTRQQRAEVTALLERYGLDLDPGALVGTLPTVKQKEVEIAKALALKAKVLLMDEPTGWLAASDVRRLHDTIRLLKAQGVGILYISHMLDEIFAVCDSMTILRDGQVVRESAVAEITRPQVVATMVGERLAEESLAATSATRKAQGGAVRLSVQGLGQRGVFQGISFDLHAGEILCLTGLIGSKRSEVVHALFGSAPMDEGRILLNGKPFKPQSPRASMAAGLGLVPEDRHREGLMLGMPIRENLVMAVLKRFSKGVLRQGAITREVAAMVQSMNIRPPNPAQLVGRLSGGTQQKVLIGKWLALAPQVLILDEPTVGVDVGAKAEIYALLRAARDRGTALLVVSSDIEEVTTLADRIGVMNRGRLVSLRPAHGVTQGQLVAEIGADA